MRALPKGGYPSWSIPDDRWKVIEQALPATPHRVAQDATADDWNQLRSSVGAACSEAMMLRALNREAKANKKAIYRPLATIGGQAETVIKQIDNLDPEQAHFLRDAAGSEKLDEDNPLNENPLYGDASPSWTGSQRIRLARNALVLLRGWAIAAAKKRASMRRDVSDAFWVTWFVGNLADAYEAHTRLPFQRGSKRGGGKAFVSDVLATFAPEVGKGTIDDACKAVVASRKKSTLVTKPARR